MLELISPKRLYKKHNSVYSTMIRERKVLICLKEIVFCLTTTCHNTAKRVRKLKKIPV